MELVKELQLYNQLDNMYFKDIEGDRCGKSFYERKVPDKKHVGTRNTQRISIRGRKAQRKLTFGTKSTGETLQGKIRAEGTRKGEDI